MNDALQTSINLFVSNTQEARNCFTWQDSLTKRLMALLYMAEHKKLDAESIKDCHKLLKMNTGTFSMFRGNSAYSIAAMLSLKPDKEKLFQNVLQVYDRMKEAKFKSSDYLTIAALLVASGTDNENYSNVIYRAKEFYDGMKSNHMFITGGNDYIFSAMLGLSDIDPKTGTINLEELYQSLKPEFGGGDGLQMLTQILLLGGFTKESLNHIVDLSKAFKDEGIRLDRRDTISSLGILSLLPANKNDIVCNVKETYDYLREEKGFGVLSISKQELLVFSTALTSFFLLDEAKSSIITGALSNTITNIILAQQAAMAAIAASSAAAATASSSSN